MIAFPFYFWPLHCTVCLQSSESFHFFWLSPHRAVAGWIEGQRYHCAMVCSEGVGYFSCVVNIGLHSNLYLCSFFGLTVKVSCSWQSKHYCSEICWALEALTKFVCFLYFLVKFCNQISIMCIKVFFYHVFQSGFFSCLLCNETNIALTFEYDLSTSAIINELFNRKYKKSLATVKTAFGSRDGRK